MVNELTAKLNSTNVFFFMMPSQTHTLKKLRESSSRFFLVDSLLSHYCFDFDQVIVSTRFRANSLRVIFSFSQNKYSAIGPPDSFLCSSTMILMVVTAFSCEYKVPSDHIVGQLPRSCQWGNDIWSIACGM